MLRYQYFTSKISYESNINILVGFDWVEFDSIVINWIIDWLDEMRHILIWRSTICSTRLNYYVCEEIILSINHRQPPTLSLTRPHTSRRRNPESFLKIRRDSLFNFTCPHPSRIRFVNVNFGEQIKRSQYVRANYSEWHCGILMMVQQSPSWILIRYYWEIFG